MDVQDSRRLAERVAERRQAEQELAAMATEDRFTEDDRTQAADRFARADARVREALAEKTRDGGVQEPASSSAAAIPGAGDGAARAPGSPEGAPPQGTPPGTPPEVGKPGGPASGEPEKAGGGAV